MRLKPIQHKFQVTYQYGIHFTESVFDPKNPLFEEMIVSREGNKPVKCLFVIDKGVQENHPDLEKDIKAYCKSYKQSLSHETAIILPGGEAVKNDYRYVELLIDAISEYKICRHSYVIAIGGGALIDMVGYAAAISHRGVRLIRIPTTVLAQNDSGVGVKNGFNTLGKKNFIGTFTPPEGVINDFRFLTTLEQRDWIAGIAEAVKVSLIKDRVFFEKLETDAIALRKRDMPAMQEQIHRCAELHMEHIALGGDPFEKGSSRPLDFGHWSAHKMEQLTNYELRHGEAVAKGIALDVVYSNSIGLLKTEDQDRILKLLQDLGFDLRFELNAAQITQLLGGIEEFREHLGGELTITLLTGIGQKKDVHEISYDKMRASLESLNKRVKLNPA